jgi:hypothetical protein
VRKPRPARVWLAVACAIPVLAIPLALARGSRGIVLYSYVLVLAAAAVIVLRGRIGSTLPATPAFPGSRRPRPPPETRVPQLEELVRRLSGGAPNAFDLHHRLRPLAREIAAARLARRHGLDLDRRPDRARELVGPRTWELVRPDREPPKDRFKRGWAQKELGELVDELERI